MAKGRRGDISLRLRRTQPCMRTGSCATKSAPKRSRTTLGAPIFALNTVKAAKPEKTPHYGSNTTSLTNGVWYHFYEQYILYYQLIGFRSTIDRAQHPISALAKEATKIFVAPTWIVELWRYILTRWFISPCAVLISFAKSHSAAIRFHVVNNAGRNNCLRS